MRQMTQIGFAVLFIVLCLALPQAYSGTMEKEKGMMEEGGMMMDEKKEMMK